METKKRVLFVDDEPRVLQALHRMLRGLRNEWEMEFVESGAEGLAKLSNDRFDVVVSDMRMPGMDGAQFLSKVMKEHPQTIRIVLSGHSDREMILKTVGPAHQYLTKPCDADVLKSTVLRAFSLRELLVNKELRDVISQMQSIPSLPSLYLEIMEEIQKPEPSMNAIGDIVSKDMGMTAKILQLVNSAFFGLPRHVSSPVDAVTLLGLETVRSLTLSVHVFSQFQNQKMNGFSLNTLWNHSAYVGKYAKEISKMEGTNAVQMDYAFLGGMLHDIGILVLSVNYPEKYQKVLSHLTSSKIELHEAEREEFSISHAEVGAYLMGLWGLPDPVIEAMAFHHNPHECCIQDFNPVIAVHAANCFDYQMHAHRIAGINPELHIEFLSSIGLTNKWLLWKKKLLEESE